MYLRKNLYNPHLWHLQLDCLSLTEIFLWMLHGPALYTNWSCGWLYWEIFLAFRQWNIWKRELSEAIFSTVFLYHMRHMTTYSKLEKTKEWYSLKRNWNDCECLTEKKIQEDIISTWKITYMYVVRKSHCKLLFITVRKTVMMCT